jgi:hypothetical protein
VTKNLVGFPNFVRNCKLSYSIRKKINACELQRNNLVPIDYEWPVYTTVKQRLLQTCVHQKLQCVANEISDIAIFRIAE